MTDYEKLLQSAYELGFIVIECSNLGNKLSGLAMDEGIALSDNLESDTERKCILAEEIAHLKLNNSDIIDLSDLNNSREELKARRLAVIRLVPFERLIETVIKLRNNANIYTVSRELDVTEEFLNDTIEIYARKYGPVKDYGAYIVTFNPFRVIEKHKS